MINNSQKSQIICPICKKQYTSSPYLNICCHSTACFYCLTKQSQQVSLKTPQSLTRRNKTPPLPSSSTTSEIHNYSIHSRTLGGSSVLQPFAHSFLSKEADTNLEMQNHSPRQDVIRGLNSQYYQQNIQQQNYCPFCHRTGQKVKFVENMILKKVLESRGIHLKPISKVLLQKYSHRLLKPQCSDESQLSVSQTNPLESSSLFKECGESKSEWKCKDCGNILLCGVCSKLLHSLGVYAKHNLEQFIPQSTTTAAQNTIKGNQQSSPSKLLKASSSKIRCQKHSDRFAAYFDMNTWQALCNDCMREARTQQSEDQSQHNIVGIQVALCKTLHDIRKKQKHITNKIIQRNDYKKGINGLIQNTELKYEQMNRKIRKGFDQLKNALQIKQNEILHDLHDCKIMSKGVLKEKSTQNQWSLDKLNLLNQVVMKGLNNPQFLFLYGIQYIMREIESFTARQKITINTSDDPIKAMIQTSLCVKDENIVQQQVLSLPQIDYPIPPNFQQMSKYISQLNVAMPQKKQQEIQNDESSPFFRDLKQKELINVVGGSDISPACTYLQSQADDVGGHNSARPSTYNTDQSSIESEQRQDPKMYRKFNRSTGFKRQMQSDHYGGMSNNKSRKSKDYKNTLIPRVATLASSSGKRMASSTDNLHQIQSARTSTSSSTLASANKKIYNHERNGSQRLQPPTKNFQKQRSSLSNLNTPCGQVIKRKANNKFNSSDSPKNAQKSSPLKKQHHEAPQTSRFTTTGKSIIELRKVESQSNLNRPSSCTNSNTSKFIFSGSSGGNKLRNHLRKNFIKTQNRESLMISGAISQISSTPRDHSGLRDSKKKKGSRYSGWINSNSRNNTNQIQPDSSSTDDQLSPKNLRVYSKDSQRYDRQRMSEHKEIGLGGYSEMLDLDEQIENRHNKIYTNTAASNYYLQQSYSSLLNNDRIKHQQQDPTHQQNVNDDKSSSQISKKKPNHKFRLTTSKPPNQKLPTNTMVQSDRDNSLYSSIQPLSISQLVHNEDNKAIDPLFKREFNIASKTSTSIQVGWTHFKNIQLPQGVQLLYHLDYVVVSKSGNVQPFRKIYKGRSFKCIITDLMPRTEYKFRVAPIIVELDGSEVKGPWSDPILTVKTQDLQKVKQSTLHPHASVRSNKGGQLINFTRPGIIHTQNPYTFGRQYWGVNIMPCVSFAYKSCDELNGSMIVGVIDKNEQNSKMIGTTINYSSLKGSTQVKLFLNAQSNCLTIFTQQEKSDNGEKFINLPTGYQFYPALQNKTVVQQPQASLTTQFIYDIKPEGFIN